MGKIYACSYCNVAATAGADGNGRLFTDRDSPLVFPSKIDINWKGHQQAYYCFPRGGLWHNGVTKASINRRGWVLQERLLSSRTLHFNGMLFWECREMRASEAFPAGIAKGMDTTPDDVDEDLDRLCPKSWRIDVTTSPDKYAVWTSVVEHFMVSGLTKGSDKLIALSGIVNNMEPVLEDTYIAGHWRHNMPFDLLWYIEKGRQADWQPSFRTREYRAPSWSWASVEGRVQFPRGKLDEEWGPPLIDIHAAEVEPATSDTSGPVKGGFIIISGTLWRMPLFSELREDVFSMKPGTVTACCVDDDYDLQYLLDVFALPIRHMMGINGQSLFCLMLTSAGGSIGIYRRVGLLALKRDDTDEFDWAMEAWDDRAEAQTAQMIRIM